MKKYLNQTELAELLNISRSTVWRRHKNRPYKTRVIGDRTHYVVVDNEPQYEED